MSQVGHADSKMTLDVYAQLEQRVKREHGVRFDALVRRAEAQLHGAEMASDWETSGRRDAESVSVPDATRRPRTKNSLITGGFSDGEGRNRTGDTTIFSRGSG
jgi:hypothetical protein